jgi:hypothetical protein
MFKKRKNQIEISEEAKNVSNKTIVKISIDSGGFTIKKLVHTHHLHNNNFIY